LNAVKRKGKKSGKGEVAQCKYSRVSFRNPNNARKTGRRVLRVRFSGVHIC